MLPYFALVRVCEIGHKWDFQLLLLFDTASQRERSKLNFALATVRTYHKVCFKPLVYSYALQHTGCIRPFLKFARKLAHCLIILNDDKVVVRSHI